jgi:hypothetical protein
VASGESFEAADDFEAADGEEFTNKIPGILGAARAKPVAHQMCRIHRDFKHFAAAKAINFGWVSNLPSIMRTKVLSIMQNDARQLRRD